MQPLNTNKYFVWAVLPLKQYWQRLQHSCKHGEAWYSIGNSTSFLQNREIKKRQIAPFLFASSHHSHKIQLSRSHSMHSDVTSTLCSLSEVKANFEQVGSNDEQVGPTLLRKLPTFCRQALPWSKFQGTNLLWMTVNPWKMQTFIPTNIKVHTVCEPALLLMILLSSLSSVFFIRIETFLKAWPSGWFNSWYIVRISTNSQGIRWRDLIGWTSMWYANHRTFTRLV